MSANSILNSQFSILPSPLIPPGYKQTEVGVIPEDWKVSELDTVAQILDPQPDHRTPPATSAGEPYIGISDFLDDHTVDWESCRKVISRAVDKQRLSFQIKQGDIIFGKIGTIGAPRFVPTVPFRYALSANVLLIQPMIDSYFVMSWLRSKICQKAVASELHSTSQAAFGINKMRCVMLPTPTKAEQEAIASALSDADTLIESLEQLIAKKRGIKQATMQQLLSPKENWIRKKLGDTATLKARIGWQGLTTAEYLKDGNYYLVTGTDFKAGYIDWENCSCVAETRYVQDRNIQLRKHDILVTKDGTIGKVALITKLPKPATLNSGVFVIRPVGNAFDPGFFYYLLCSQVFAEFLSQLCAGSTINHLYQKDFIHFSYQTPESVPEQTAIAEVLSDMDAGIDALEGKLVKARWIKQGMMQELLTGRIRLA